MKCKYPTVFNRALRDAPNRCGRCLHCRIHTRRVWAHRIVLESLNHVNTVFLTLTYAPEHLPTEFVHPKTGQVFAPLSVNPDHHRLFMNNLRYHFKEQFNEKLRFYAVGEYGEKTQRPHYHYALFGFPPCLTPKKTSSHFTPCKCSNCAVINRAWGKGHIFAGNLTLDSANYISGYVTKKLTTDSNYRQEGYTGQTNAEKLAGRHPEFSRQSRRPGIASWASDSIANALDLRGLTDKSDVPHTLSHGPHHLPLGRYLVDKIHEKLHHEFQPKEKIKAYEAQLRSMLETHENFANFTPIYQNSVRAALEFVNRQSSVNLERYTSLASKEKII